MSAPYGDPYPLQPSGRHEARYGVSLPKAVGLFFTRYVDFRGRSSRSEYLWVTLFLFLVLVVGGVLIGVSEAGNPGSSEPGPVATLLSVLLTLFLLGVVVPSIALQCRRLRDAGFSALLVLLCLVPYLGSFIVFILCCLPTSGTGSTPAGHSQSPYGQPGYGQSPYGQPGYGHSPYGQPGYGEQTSEQSPDHQPGYGPPPAGRSTEGQPTDGQPTAGQPPTWSQQPGAPSPDQPPDWQQPPAPDDPWRRS